MAAADPELRDLASRSGVAKRRGHADAEKLRAELAELRLKAAIRKIVASSPPISRAQADRVAALLRTAATPVDAA